MADSFRDSPPHSAEVRRTQTEFSVCWRTHKVLNIICHIRPQKFGWFWIHADSRGLNCDWTGKKHNFPNILSLPNSGGLLFQIDCNSTRVSLKLWWTIENYSGFISPPADWKISLDVCGVMRNPADTGEVSRSEICLILNTLGLKIYHVTM